jgi:UDP-N-acetylmuramate dehydrogenase
MPPVEIHPNPLYHDAVPRLKESLEKINIAGTLRAEEPMHRHTTFEVGGPAELYVRPETAGDVQAVVRAAGEAQAPVFILGGGSNILVADRGVRGVVMDMRGFCDTRRENTRFTAGAGLPISDAAERAVDEGLGGLHFLYSMPGSVGGAVWMNARCYGSSIADVLEEVRLVDETGEYEVYTPREEDFGYKRSPFQSRRAVILDASFRLEPVDPRQARAEMKRYYADREGKGHFAAPSAGSVFKNNRAFGSPTGAIIDTLGLRGRQIGGARLSDKHANIIVNTGDATASDILRLIELIERRVREELGLELEREVLLVGDWEAEHAVTG